MKRLWILSLVFVFFLSWVAGAQAKPRIYKWVKDKKVSSKQVLRKSQSQRVIPVSEPRTLEMVQQVMTDDLYLALGEYRKTKHLQEAETTDDSVLPEEIISEEEVELVDEDYGFLLEVKLRKYGARTRVTAKAHPIYRIRDLEAEDAESDEDEAGTIEIKVKAGRDQAVAVGPMFIAPIIGRPSDYDITILPDAAARAGKLVKSFMYLLDKRVSAAKE